MIENLGPNGPRYYRYGGLLVGALIGAIMTMVPWIHAHEVDAIFVFCFALWFSGWF